MRENRLLRRFEGNVPYWNRKLPGETPVATSSRLKPLTGKEQAYWDALVGQFHQRLNELYDAAEEMEYERQAFSADPRDRKTVGEQDRADFWEKEMHRVQNEKTQAEDMADYYELIRKLCR